MAKAARITFLILIILSNKICINKIANELLPQFQRTNKKSQSSSTNEWFKNRKATKFSAWFFDSGGERNSHIDLISQITNGNYN